MESNAVDSIAYLGSALYIGRCFRERCELPYLNICTFRCITRFLWKGWHHPQISLLNWEYLGLGPVALFVVRTVNLYISFVYIGFCMLLWHMVIVWYMCLFPCVFLFKEQPFNVPVVYTISTIQRVRGKKVSGWKLPSPSWILESPAWRLTMGWDVMVEEVDSFVFFVEGFCWDLSWEKGGITCITVERLYTWRLKVNKNWLCRCLPCILFLQETVKDLLQEMGTRLRHGEAWWMDRNGGCFKPCWREHYVAVY